MKVSHTPRIVGGFSLHAAYDPQKCPRENPALREIIDNCARDAARDTGKTVRLVKFVRVQDTEVVEGGRNAKEGKTD